MDVWVCHWKRSDVYSDVEDVVDSKEKAAEWVENSEKKMVSPKSSVYWYPVATKMTIH